MVYIVCNVDHFSQQLSHKPKFPSICLLAGYVFHPSWVFFLNRSIIFQISVEILINMIFDLIPATAFFGITSWRMQVQATLHSSCLATSQPAPKIK